MNLHRQMYSHLSSLTGSIFKLTSLTIFLACLLLCSTFTPTEAYDDIDPNGKVTIKWDVISWTPDGYVAAVTIYNFQQYRQLQGWTLGWKWGKQEVIWSMMGAQTTEQGNCSRFKGNMPHSCKKDPTVVDLLPGTPYNQQIANCCKGGVISSLAQDPANAVSSFQVRVGDAGTSNKTVRTPKRFNLKAAGTRYNCRAARIVRRTKFISADKWGITEALMTWNVSCGYSRFLNPKTPTCCVSLSSYNDTVVGCRTCACGCQNSTDATGSCVNSDAPHLASVVSSGKPETTPLVQCTGHMCPIRVHWHVKLDHKQYWQVEVTVTNFKYKMNYTQWNIVVQHPNSDNLTQLFSFKSLTPYDGLNDTAMLQGVEFYDDLLAQAGPSGNVQAELLFPKDKSAFTFVKGWAFPRRIYFNGDSCLMPTPDAYPLLPNGSFRPIISLLRLVMTFLVYVVFFFAYI
ncbi:protein COBRA-like [Manihot esculenta]|uniref:Uncharacterized protein n=1 Tax=Manihot esculenta TaxID=3983 RepID=A0ACB7GGR8_MANES|nr:protein COBRA-like [Manihot esculenta]KAG8638984.1 hypothetical protein MANES_14G087750v8 [Manihot esculenta]